MDLNGDILIALVIYLEFQWSCLHQVQLTLLLLPSLICISCIFLTLYDLKKQYVHALLEHFREGGFVWIQIYTSLTGRVCYGSLRFVDILWIVFTLLKGDLLRWFIKTFFLQALCLQQQTRDFYKFSPQSRRPTCKRSQIKSWQRHCLWQTDGVTSCNNFKIIPFKRNSRKHLKIGWC